MRLVGDRKRALLIDTGANQGDFSKEAMRLLSSLRLTAMVHPILLEPQPQFGPQLQDLAARWNGTYVPAAAWKGRANITFYKSRNSETTSIRRTMAARYRNTGQSRMPTVDMALFLHEVATRDVPILLKIDVEVSATRIVTGMNHQCLMCKVNRACSQAAEYHLLPHLLVHGALCRRGGSMRLR